MGSSSSCDSRNAKSRGDLNEEEKDMLCTIVEDAGLSTLTVDDVTQMLQGELGITIQHKRHAIQQELQLLQSEGARRRKITPHIRRVVRESMFSHVTRQQVLCSLESAFGQDVHQHMDLVTTILEEETKRHALDEGQPIPGTEYLLGETLGQGRYGLVRRAVLGSTQEVFAVKMISTELTKAENMRQQLTREIAVMKSLVHENILQLYEVVETAEHICLVLELVDGGELFECFAPPDKIFPEPMARNVFQQLIMAMYYCHKQGVAHRDLKPANLLMTYSRTLKVSDFGLSTFQHQSESGNVHESMQLQTCCGSPKFVAPEVVSTEKGYNGFMADMWSCGIILFLMLAGHAPFEHSTVSGLLKKVISGKYDMPATFSPGASDLILKLLVVQPEKRIAIKDILTHPWFEVDFDKSKVEAITNMTVRVPQRSASKSNETAPSTFIVTDRGPADRRTSKSPQLSPMRVDVQSLITLASSPK